MKLVDKAVLRFPNVAQLAEYSIENHKIFPLRMATGSLGLIMRHLFNPRLDDARRKGRGAKRGNGRGRKAKEQQEVEGNRGRQPYKCIAAFFFIIITTLSWRPKSDHGEPDS